MTKSTGLKPTYEKAYKVVPPENGCRLHPDCFTCPERDCVVAADGMKKKRPKDEAKVKNA